MNTPNDPAAMESGIWCQYFRAAATVPTSLPWDDPTTLTREESRCIQSSIQQFQLGEGARGSRLLKRGQEYAKATADPHFVEALTLFVKEEQRHSAHLLRFMQREGIPASSKHWVDTIFRRLRVLGGLELALRVLVSADRIASAIHRSFLFVTCQVVWSEHRRVFHAAGYARAGFLAQAFWEFDRLDAAVGCGPLRACIPMANEEDEELTSASPRAERAMMKTRD